MGEIVVCTEQGDTKWVYKVAHSDNCITNGLELAEGHTGALTLLAANNDDKARVLDPEAGQKVQEFELGWAANCVVVNPASRCARRCCWFEHVCPFVDKKWQSAVVVYKSVVCRETCAGCSTQQALCAEIC